MSSSGHKSHKSRRSETAVDAAGRNTTPTRSSHHRHKERKPTEAAEGGGRKSPSPQLSSTQAEGARKSAHDANVSKEQRHHIQEEMGPQATSDERETSAVDNAQEIFGTAGHEPAEGRGEAKLATTPHTPADSASVPLTAASEVIEALSHYDRDNSGTISKAELQRLLTTMGEALTSSEVGELFHELDKRSSCANAWAGRERLHDQSMADYDDGDDIPYRGRFNIAETVRGLFNGQEGRKNSSNG